MEENSEDIPRELRQGFWVTVITLNLAVLGISIGAILWFFTESSYTAPVFLFGVVNTGFSLVLYRKYRPSN